MCIKVQQNIKPLHLSVITNCISFHCIFLNLLKNCSRLYKTLITRNCHWLWYFPDTLINLIPWLLRPSFSIKMALDKNDINVQYCNKHLACFVPSCHLCFTAVLNTNSKNVECVHANGDKAVEPTHIVGSIFV